MDMHGMRSEMVPNEDMAAPVRTEEEIRVIMDTIRMYLEQTKEVMDRIEKFVKELTLEIGKSYEKQINSDSEKKQDEIQFYPGV